MSLRWWNLPSVVPAMMLKHLLWWGLLPETTVNGNHNSDVDSISPSRGQDSEIKRTGWKIKTIAMASVSLEMAVGLSLPVTQIAVAIVFARAVKGHLRLWSVTATTDYKRPRGEVKRRNTDSFRCCWHAPQQWVYVTIVQILNSRWNNIPGVSTSSTYMHFEKQER